MAEQTDGVGDATRGRDRSPIQDRLTVSVVVPTYRPDAGLERLLASLRGQTLAADRFEVVLVDDGSPDDDVARIRSLIEDMPNARLERIEHSGWPSRPRNVGIDLAAGDYVLFADHDDELYATSLADALGALARTDADVYAGKEARTDQAKWALDAFDGNHDDAGRRPHVHALVPTNPHKLYRTRLLRDHGIRFPEGGRQLWEDVHFNIDVAHHSPRVTIRSDEPFYHWVRSGRTTSTSFGEDAAEWWNALARVIRHIESALEGAEFADQRRQLLIDQFRDRVLPAVGPTLLDRAASERASVLDRAAELVGSSLPADLEALLPRHLAARAHLLRVGRNDLVEALAEYDRGILGITFARTVTADEVIRLETRTVWTAHHGGFLDLVVEGEHVRRRLSTELETALGAEYLLLDRDLATAQSTVGLRSRDTAMTWLVPTTTELRVSAEPGYPDVTAVSTATVDPATLRCGLPMANGYWDFNARNRLFGVVNHRAIRALDHSASSTTPRRLRVYPNIHGNLSLQLH